jgi:hypothetical protein
MVEALDSDVLCTLSYNIFQDFDQLSFNSFIRMNLPTFEEMLRVTQIEISTCDSDEMKCTRGEIQ